MRFSPAILLCALLSAPGFAACPPLLNHTFPSLVDKPTSLCQFEGKVVLVVNTASRCVYTPQYQGLEALYRRYRAGGLVVLGFPANDFGAQEPGSNKEIATFCELNYGVSFPMFAKTGVAVGDANPFYVELAEKTGVSPGWNFHKYLVDRSGEKVVSFDSRVEPGDSSLVAEIERLLAQPSPRP